MSKNLMRLCFLFLLIVLVLPSNLLADNISETCASMFLEKTICPKDGGSPDFLFLFFNKNCKNTSS